MKRSICILIVFLIAFSLFGCKTKKANDNTDIPANQSGNSDVIDNAENTSDDVKSDVDETDKSKINESVDHPQENTDKEDDINDGSDITQDIPAVDDGKEDIDDTVNVLIEQPIEDENETAPEPFSDILKYNWVASDIFSAKIVDVSEYNGACDIPMWNIQKTTKVYLCKAEVEQTYRSTFIQPKTTVEFITISYDYGTGKAYSKEYEEGKVYIISATVQPLDGEPIMADTGFLNFMVEKDGTLTPMTNGTVSSIANRDMTTVEKFEECKEVRTDFKAFSHTFTRYVKTDKTEQQLIDDIKKAIIADSDFKMNLERKDEVK